MGSRQALLQHRIHEQALRAFTRGGGGGSGRAAERLVFSPEPRVRIYTISPRRDPHSPAPPKSPHSRDSAWPARPRTLPGRVGALEGLADRRSLSELGQRGRLICGGRECQGRVGRTLLPSVWLSAARAVRAQALHSDGNGRAAPKRLSPESRSWPARRLSTLHFSGRGVGRVGATGVADPVPTRDSPFLPTKLLFECGVRRCHMWGNV
jgi:hypothetical protein